MATSYHSIYSDLIIALACHRWTARNALSKRFWLCCTRFVHLNLEARVPKTEIAEDLVRLTGYQVLTTRN